MELSEVVSSGSSTIHDMIIGQVTPIKSSKKEPTQCQGIKTTQVVSHKFWIEKTLSPNIYYNLYSKWST